MKKGLYIVLALSAIAFYGCSGAGSKDASQEASSQESISQEATQETVPLIPMARATADDLPPVVLEGEGYHVEIPADEEGIECTPVSDERVEELRQQGYEFIGQPIHVSRNGDNHVELKKTFTNAPPS